METRLAIVLILFAALTSPASATSVGGPVHCSIPREAVRACIPAHAVLRVVVSRTENVTSAKVESVAPTPLFAKWAQCMAAKLGHEVLPGVGHQLGPGLHSMPLNFDPGECKDQRSNNSFKPKPLRGSA